LTAWPWPRWSFWPGHWRRLAGVPRDGALCSWRAARSYWRRGSLAGPRGCRRPALQLSQPQLEPPVTLTLTLTLTRRVKARPQRRDLPIPVRQQPPQPRIRSPQPGGVISSELIRHSRQASTAAADQIDAR
jgi:hypothetical protein